MRAAGTLLHTEKRRLCRNLEPVFVFKHFPREKAS